MRSSITLIDTKEITIVQFERGDGKNWPNSVRMTLRYGTNVSGLTTRQVHELQWLSALTSQDDRIVEVYGMADRQGRQDYNMALSKKRITTVLQTMKVQGAKQDSFARGLSKALGEDFAEWFGKVDSKPDAYDRAVVVFAWSGLDGFIGIGSTLPVCRFGRGGHGVAVN